MNAQRLFFRSLYIIFKVITIKMLIHIFFFSGLFDILPSQVESQILSDGNVKVFDLNKLVSNGINNLTIKYKRPLIFGLIGKPKIYATRYLKGMGLSMNSTWSGMVFHHYFWSHVPQRTCLKTIPTHPLRHTWPEVVIGNHTRSSAVHGRSFHKGLTKPTIIFM